MAIEIRHGEEANLYSKAGQMIGQAQAAQAQWEVEKNLMLQRQEFEQTLRLRQMEYDKINLANEWDVKKMMMRSELDFQQEEKERLEKIASLSNKLQALDKAEESGAYDADTLTNARLEIQLELASAKAGGKTPVTQIPMHQARPQSIQNIRREKEALVGVIEGETMADLDERLIKAGYDPFTLQPFPPVELTGKKVLVRSPDGVEGTLDEAEIGLPQYANYEIIDEKYQPAIFGGGEGGKFGGTGATGVYEVEEKFPYKKVGSIEDLYNYLKKQGSRKVGSIEDLYNYLKKQGSRKIGSLEDAYNYLRGK